MRSKSAGNHSNATKKLRSSTMDALDKLLKLNGTIAIKVLNITRHLIANTTITCLNPLKPINMLNAMVGVTAIARDVYDNIL